MKIRIIERIEANFKSCFVKINIINNSIIKSCLNSFVLFFKDKTQAGASNEKKYDPAIESLALKAKTRQEVADEYGITVKTFKSRLIKAKIKVPPGRIFPKILKIIYYTFGIPAGLKSS